MKRDTLWLPLAEAAAGVRCGSVSKSLVSTIALPRPCQQPSGCKSVQQGQVALCMMMCTCKGEAIPHGRYMADLVIALLQDYAAATALFPLRPAELDDMHRDLPEPALLRDWGNAPVSCVHGGPLHLAALHNTVPLTLSVKPLCSCADLHGVAALLAGELHRGWRGHSLKALCVTPLLRGICAWHRFSVSCHVLHVRQEHYAQAPVRKLYYSVADLTTPRRCLPAVCIATVESTGSRSREQTPRLVRASAWHCCAAGMPLAGAEDHNSPASAQPTPQQSLKHVMGVQTQGFAWVDANKTTSDAHPGGWASARVGDVLEIQARTRPFSLMVCLPLAA